MTSNSKDNTGSLVLSNKVETYKKIKTSNNSFDRIFVNLKENKRKPKYDYTAGICAGLLLRDFSHLVLLKNETPQNLLETIVGEAKLLVETYNWKRDNLYELLAQCFNEGKSK